MYIINLYRYFKSINIGVLTLTNLKILLKQVVEKNKQNNLKTITIKILNY